MTETETLAQYKARGGFVANVPFPITHVYTRTKAMRKTMPREPAGLTGGWSRK